MALHNILVHVADDTHCEQRIVSACELARRNQADITGLYVRPYPVVIPAAPIGGAIPVIEGLSQAFEKACKEGRDRFHAAVSRAGITSDWHEADGDAAENIAIHTRYADLAVVGQWSPDETPEQQPRDLAALVALSAGRPVLMLPYAGDHTLSFERVMLCWDGSREAVRAAHDMLGMLPHGSSVDIVCIDPEDSEDRDPGADIARHLASHGLKVDAHRMSKGDITIADTLLSASADLGSDLIVLGAYGHARMREIAFGGTTRAMLANAPLPLLLSH
mgnify:CR=1 FL=1|jgi:nucleotide-binding universal stress UspA family protein